jgi:hypothetical protein
MKCYKCPFYRSSSIWNRCDLTESECFREPENCSLVNDDGTVNQEEYNKAFGEDYQS